MPTLECTWEEFKRASKEFYDAAPALNSDELDNAFKALGLMYMGMTDKQWEHSAAILFGMMSRVCTKRELELDNERTS